MMYSVKKHIEKINGIWIIGKGKGHKRFLIMAIIIYILKILKYI